MLRPSDLSPRPPVERSRETLLHTPAASSGLRAGTRLVSRTLRRQWPVLLGVVVLALTVAAAYLVLRPDIYQAESLLVAQSDDGPSVDDALTIGFVAGPEQTSADEQLLTLQESTDLVQHVAARLLGPGDDADAGRVQAQRDLAQNLRETVALSSREPNAIAITVSGADPVRVARVANIYAQVAIDYARAEGTRRLTASREFVEERLASAETDLEAAEGTLANYQTRQGIAGLDTEVATVVNDGARLASSLREATVALQTRRASIRATQAELQRIRPGLSPQVGSGVGREIEAAQVEISALETRLEQFYQNTPDARGLADDARTRQLRSEIDQWRRRVSTLSARYVQESLASGGANASDAGSGLSYASELERRLVDDRIAVTGLQAQIAAQRRQVSGNAARRQAIPRQSSDVVQLERRRATAEQLYTFLASALQQVQIAETSQIGSLQLLRRAEVPGAPLRSGPGRVLGLAGALGLLLGFGAAVARSSADDRVHTPEDVEATQIRLLSVIPQLDHVSRETGAQVNADGVTLPTANLVSMLQPESAAAEAYRHLYTRIQVSLPDRVAQVVMVTGPEMGAGKSTTALNLAATMVLAGRRTLVIDADLRRPSVRRYLGGGGPTLEELLSRDEADDASVLVESAYTPVWNLFALGSEPTKTLPFELLSSRRMRELLVELRERFDTIVIDTPPMLVASDAVLLAPLCDACVLVVSSGQTDTEALVQAAGELEEAGGLVIGAVLNHFVPSEARYRHTYGYRERHYADYHSTS